MSLRLISFFSSALLMPTLVTVATPMDSADFAFKYEADTVPTLATPAWTLENGVGYANSASGGVYSQTTLTNPNRGSLSFNIPDGAEWDIQDGVGYTAEIKIRILSATGTNLRDGVWFDIGDGTSNAGIQILDSEVRRTQLDTVNTTFSTAVANVNNWQVYRLVVSDDHATFAVYLNNTLIQNDLSTYSYTSPLDRIRWGDPTTTNGTTDTAFDIDYIRWDTTGAYAPLPEPASLGLLVIGAGLVARRREE
jgi:hypothetical protein